jgi:hypothetical protein
MAAFGQKQTLRRGDPPGYLWLSWAITPQSHDTKDDENRCKKTKKNHCSKVYSCKSFWVEPEREESEQAHQ